MILSHVRSAASRFNFPFSSSICLGFLISGARRPLNRLFQLWIVASLTPSFRHGSSTFSPFSIYFKTTEISASVNLLLRGIFLTPSIAVMRGQIWHFSKIKCGYFRGQGQGRYAHILLVRRTPSKVLLLVYIADTSAFCAIRKQRGLT